MANDERKLRLIEKLTRELGPVVMGALKDPKVIEIMLNPDGRIWVERFGEPMKVCGTMSPTNAEALLTTVASSLGTTVTKKEPIVEGELIIDGSRFEGILPPNVTAPIFAIRKKASSVFSLDQYVDQGIMTQAQRAAMREAVRERKNVVVSGGTGSGKTTLLNAFLLEVSEVDPEARLGLIEDTKELQCRAQNYFDLRTSEYANMVALLRAVMRLRPDRIIVGEVRGPEAYALMSAWNTGHPGGIASVHADDTRRALRRIARLVEQGGVKLDPESIADAVGVIVQIAKVQGKRRITEMVRVLGFENGQYVLEPILGDNRETAPTPSPTLNPETQTHARSVP